MKIQIILLLFIATTLSFVINMKVGGTIETPEKLAVELESPKQSPQEWIIGARSPMKYRALFRMIVQGTWEHMPGIGGGFYCAYLGWSFAFFFLTSIVLFLFLRNLSFSEYYSLIGCLFFFVSPPVLLAYLFPTHTREDPLAYLIIILGLYATTKMKSFWVTVIGVISATCRETLLIIPLLYFLLYKNDVKRRVFVLALPIIMLLIVRIGLGYESYDIFKDVEDNYYNPLESILAVFLIFGAFWLPALIKWLQLRKDMDGLSHEWKAIVVTFLPALVLIMTTHIFLARAREIRISFLLFPWIIPLSLAWCADNMINLKEVFTDHRDKLKVYTFTFALIVLLSLAYFAENIFKPFLVTFHNRFWLLALLIHCSLTYVFFLSINAFRRKQVIKKIL